MQVMRMPWRAEGICRRIVLVATFESGAFMVYREVFSGMAPCRQSDGKMAAPAVPVLA